MAFTFRKKRTRRLKNGKVRTFESRNWYAGYWDPATGRWRHKAGYTDRQATEELAKRLEREAARRAEGLLPPEHDHARTPLTAHIDAYGRVLRAKDDGDTHVRKVCRMIQAACEFCGWRFPRDISADRLLIFLADLRRDREPVAVPPGAAFRPGEVAELLGVSREAVYKQVKRLRIEAIGRGKARRIPRAAVELLARNAARGHSTQTANYYLGAVKRFCRWMVRDRRMAENPVEHLQGGNADLDRRHQRRDLAPDELGRLLDVTLTSRRSFRGLSGADRYHLYMAACGTGFRAGELAALTTESFLLDADPPAVRLPLRTDKARRGATQPLPPQIADALRGYLARRPKGQPVWPGTWAEKASVMVNDDLREAGIDYIVESEDGPLHADFHALRHTYISILARAGFTVKQVQKLSRHSTPELTFGRYAHADLKELGDAVGEKMPRLPTRRGGTKGGT
jgi:excisionase family DNA binding protein